MKTALVALALLATGCAVAAPSAPATPDAPTDPAPTAPDPVPLRQYATQLTAPSPSYTRSAPRVRTGEHIELVREPTAKAPADAKAIGKLWVERLEARRALGGYGLSGKREDDPVSSITTLMTARDFDAWVAANGWSAPRHIRWDFMMPMGFPAAQPAALAKVRVWPVSQVRTGAQNQALLGGRIYLQDGCFYVDRPEGWGYGPAGRHLVIFGAETGLMVDDEGYLALYDRISGEMTARIGEDMNWSGPNGAPTEDAPGIAEIRAACGKDPLEFVGNVVAAEKFYTEYPHTRPKR